MLSIEPWGGVGSDRVAISRSAVKKRKMGKELPGNDWKL
jgi:hypothetical protein